MKKMIALLLALVMCLTLCACGATTEPAEDIQAVVDEATVSPTDDVGEETAEEPVEAAEPTPIELSIPLGDDFTIVEATYDTDFSSDGDVQVYLKLKNETDFTFSMVAFQTYSYDKNGDRVGGHYISVPDMEAGHATWTFSISTDLPLEDFGSIKIEYYDIQEWLDDNSVASVKYVELDPKAEVFLEQMTLKG